MTSTEIGKGVLRIEGEAVLALAERLNHEFSGAVEAVLGCSGRVIVTGMGKSGLICQKLAATLTSTGTPAFFLHPAEGVHGDLGLLMKGDLVIAISNSGETEELIRILPGIKRLGLPLIVLTGRLKSTLSRSADFCLDVSVREEACPLGLAPTASTTAALAMGDALAVSLLVKRGFREEDFALFHPGGNLGKSLILKVGDVMHKGEALPAVLQGTLLKNALGEISAKKLGVTGVVDVDRRLVGVFTDGDLRRTLEKGIESLDRPIEEFMTRNPKRILVENLAAKALQRMEQYAITSLFVFEKEESLVPVGIIHLHDLLKSGIA